MAAGRGRTPHRKPDSSAGETARPVPKRARRRRGEAGGPHGQPEAAADDVRVLSGHGRKDALEPSGPHIGGLLRAQSVAK